MLMMRKLIPILCLALLTLAPGFARADIPEGFIGMSPQNLPNKKDYQLMDEAGVQSVRLPLNWNGLQPVDPVLAETDWRGFDHAVGLAAENGMEVFPFVFGTPKWLTAEWTDLPVRNARQRRAWAVFLREAAERYGPSGSFWEEHENLHYIPIRRWEIWNEQNIVTFATDPDPVEFARLIRISGRVLHRVDPGSKAIVGGLFGRPLQVPPNVASGDFLNRLYRAGNIKRYFDGVALHPYVADARAMKAQMENLRRIMRFHGDARTPTYLTELGWGSRSGPTRWERGLRGQARQLSKAFSMISANRHRWRLRGAWWFTWTDEGGSCLFCNSAGLLTEKRRAKPAWYRFNAWTGGDPDAVPRGLFGPSGEELEPAEEPAGGSDGGGATEQAAPAPALLRR
jgi:hypothetical protein